MESGCMKRWKRSGRRRREGSSGGRVLLGQKISVSSWNYSPFCGHKNIKKKKRFPERPSDIYLFLCAFLLLDLVPSCHFSFTCLRPTQSWPFPGLWAGHLATSIGHWVCVWFPAWTQALTIGQTQLSLGTWLNNILPAMSVGGVGRRGGGRTNWRHSPENVLVWQIGATGEGFPSLRWGQWSQAPLLKKSSWGCFPYVRGNWGLFHWAHWL